MEIKPFSAKAAAFSNRDPVLDRFITILEGSIRSGKTWAMIPKILFMLCPYPVAGEKIIFGVTKETIYNNVLNDLFNFVGPRAYSYNRQTGQMWLSGSKWRVIGAKDEGSEKYIRGATVGLAYGDELVLIPKSFVEMMLGRMSPEGARFYGTTNPDTPYHWLYKDYITSEVKHQAKLIEVIKFTLRDNTSLSAETRQRYETQFKGVFKQRMIEGQWVVAEGAIYRDCYLPDVID